MAISCRDQRFGRLRRARAGCAPRAVYSAFILVAGLMMQVAADEGAVAAPPNGAWLESADGRIIGSVTGHVWAQDQRGTRLGAYGVVSTRGFFAEVLPSGELAQVDRLVYGKPGCAGPPAIEVASVDGRAAPVPSYVFAFGVAAQLWQVPPTARAGDFAIASRLERGDDGYRCLAVTQQALVYPLAANRSELTGITRNYRAPLAVRPQTHHDASAIPGSNEPARHETGAGAVFDNTTPQCAAGCFSPYLGDGICEAECANSLCDFDANDCSAAFVTRARQREASLCAPTCETTDLGDGFCDLRCNVATCEFDHGDCKPP